jgi:hypothetical protein
MRFPKCQSKLIAIYFHSSEIFNIQIGGRAFCKPQTKFYHVLSSQIIFVLGLKIGISRLSSECGNSDFPDAVFFTLQQKLGEIAL